MVGFRGLQACFDVLRRRQDWLEKRAGGTLDKREAVAIRYALGLLEVARQDPELIRQLEDEALENGDIEPDWIEPRGE